MFKGILLTEIGKRPVIVSPQPKPAYDANGKILKNGRPIFTVKADPLDFALAKLSPIKQSFHDRYVIDGDNRATPLQLAVFHALARTTEWAEAGIIMDQSYAPILQPSGQGQAVILTHGNRTATRTIQQLCDEVGGSYDATRKALGFWEKLGMIQAIPTYEKNSVREQHRQSGRPVEFRRYEIDPIYVWNGPIWIGVAYSLLTMTITN